MESIYSAQRASKTLSGPYNASENEQFCEMVERMILAMERRVSDGDIEGLRALAQLRRVVDGATHRTVTRLRAEPWNYSWADIGRVLQITRQSAQERFGH